jgi:hypothetical protein
MFRSRDDLRTSHSNCSNSSSNDSNSNHGVNYVTEQLRRQKMADVVFDNNHKKRDAVAGGGSRILSFKSKAPAADEAHMNNLKVRYIALFNIFVHFLLILSHVLTYPYPF